jgi:hypothetical protein
VVAVPVTALWLRSKSEGVVAAGAGAPLPTDAPY